MGVSGSRDFDIEFLNKYSTAANLLGRGAFGSVFGPIKRNNLQLAIKQVLLKYGKDTDKIRRDIEEKQQIWNKLDHKHVMKIYSVNLNQLPKALYIVMEYASGGSLDKTLRSLGSKNKLPIDVVTDLAKQIADGMWYLHKRNIVHRDLKPSNLLLMKAFDDLNPQRRMTLKIADIDEVKEHDHTTTMSLVGTCSYTAPEVLATQRFSKASDVWSFGVLTWEMLTGDIPHNGQQPQEIMLKSLTGELDNLSIEDSFPEDFKSILNRCWETDYRRRLSFAEIIFILQPMMEETHAANAIELYQHGREQFETGPLVLNDLVKQPVRAIFGLSVLGNEAFILRERCSKIEVYDSTTFFYKRKIINVDGMTNPENLASCSVNNCLYTFDWEYKKKRRAILRIDPTNGHLIKSWNVYGGGGRLSVANDTNVILNINFEAKLKEYTADGKIVRIINLDTDRTGISRSWHAIKLDSGLFVVCHGGSDDPLSRVCLFSPKQNNSPIGGSEEAIEVDVLKIFGAEPGEMTDGRLRRPIYLSLNKAGSILVSDGKTVLMSSNLDKPQIISEEDE